jgi:signal transduction histidine kinase
VYSRIDSSVNGDAPYTSSAVVTDSLISLVASLAGAGDRTQRADALARELGATSLLIFIRDEEVGAHLPAPGFRQTLPDGRAWRAFVAECAEHGRCVATLPFHSLDERLVVVGYSDDRDVVFVLLGTEHPNDGVETMRALMPLVVATLRGEQEVAVAGLRARVSREEAARSGVVTAALDRARHQLEGALRDARDAHAELRRVNTELERHSAELEYANEQLHNQADEMAAQALELELQANELQTANIALDEARAAAEFANRAKSDFLATMSHELRTPLNAIGGYVELLSMGIHGPVTPAQSDALTRVRRSQRHLLGLINSILNLARIEAGALRYAMAEVALPETIADLASMIDPQIAAKSLRYELRDVESVPAVYADREKLQQILLNLLSNAVKFTPAGGLVWIDAQAVNADPARVAVRVADTGQGIPGPKLEWIFEPFTQVDASRSRVGQGAGLGLAISRDLARGMGGDLTATSEVGKGSVFTLTLGARHEAHQ